MARNKNRSTEKEGERQNLIRDYKKYNLSLFNPLS